MISHRISQINTEEGKWRKRPRMTDDWQPTINKKTKTVIPDSDPGSRELEQYTGY
ncbi:MAG TPA: hypothetical protein VKA34_17095 [Balneolales bacterium]|nr:hypothetical protein [Balneolales bacterium]